MFALTPTTQTNKKKTKTNRLLIFSRGVLDHLKVSIVDS